MKGQRDLFNFSSPPTHQQILSPGQDEPARILVRRSRVDQLARVQSLSITESLDIARNGVAEELAELSDGEGDTTTVFAIGVESHETPKVAKSGNRDCGKMSGQRKIEQKRERTTHSTWRSGRPYCRGICNSTEVSSIPRVTEER